MKLKSLCPWSALALLVFSTACTKASPTRPSDASASGATTSATDAVTGVTLTSPALVTPAVNQQFKNAEQPLTLTVKNAVTLGRTALTYTFEVAWTRRSRPRSTPGRRRRRQRHHRAEDRQADGEQELLLARARVEWNVRRPQHRDPRLRRRAGGDPGAAGQR
jgi:hypothetical protein